MTGAVDLSGLKQRAPQGSAERRRPAGGVEVTEANFEAEVLVRSGEVPGGRPAVVAAQRGLRPTRRRAGRRWPPPTTASGRWPPSTSTPRRGWPRCSASRRCPPWWPWPADSRWPASRARSRPSSCGAGSTRCWRRQPASSAATADAEAEHASTPRWPTARDNLDAGDFVAAAAAYQAILDADPNHAEAKGALRQITFLQRATAHVAPDAVAVADAAPDDIDAAFAAADVADPQPGRRRRVRPVDRVGASGPPATSAPGSAPA